LYIVVSSCEVRCLSLVS